MSDIYFGAFGYRSSLALLIAAAAGGAVEERAGRVERRHARLVGHAGRRGGRLRCAFAFGSTGWSGSRWPSCSTHGAPSRSARPTVTTRPARKPWSSSQCCPSTETVTDQEVAWEFHRRTGRAVSRSSAP